MHQLIQPAQQVLGRSKLHLEHSGPDDAHTGGQGSRRPGVARNRKYDLAGAEVAAGAFQVLGQPLPATVFQLERGVELKGLKGADELVAAD